MWVKKWTCYANVLELMPLLPNFISAVFPKLSPSFSCLAHDPSSSIMQGVKPFLPSASRFYPPWILACGFSFLPSQFWQPTLLPAVHASATNSLVPTPLPSPLLPYLSAPNLAVSSSLPFLSGPDAQPSSTAFQKGHPLPESSLSLPHQNALAHPSKLPSAADHQCLPCCDHLVLVSCTLASWSVSSSEDREVPLHHASYIICSQ